MNTLRTLKKLLLGETWLLPLGMAAVVVAADLLIRPAASGAWKHLGGFVVLAGVVLVLLTAVARAARRSSRP
jgi:membrane protein implicated in regulation of membrane protease activity